MKKQGSSTITKIVTVLVITVGVMAGITISSYNSYKEFISAIGSLGADVEEDELSYKISTDLNELQSKSRAYSLSLERRDLDSYIRQTQTLKKHIEELYVQSLGRSFRPDVDSLRSYLRLKQENYRNLIELKLSQSDAERVRDVMTMLAKGEDKLVSTDKGPKQEVTTTTITQPVNTGNNVAKEKDKPSFFKRIFGSSSEESDENEDKEDSKTVPRTTQQTVVKYDSAYVKQVDTLISSVKSALAEAERTRINQQKELETRELALLRNDQEILQSLRKIIDKIKSSQKQLTSTQRDEALKLTSNSFLSVISFAAMGGVLTILLIVLVIRDIISNERLQAELAKASAKAENLARVKEEFLANMSHEIRTPLNSIIGFTNQMAETQMDDEQMNNLRHVQSSSEHLLILVNDILDFSKIESGKMRIDSIGFKVEDVVIESLKTIQHQAEIKGIQLRHEIDPELNNVFMKGDPMRLKQILINLTGNGVKFTSHGYVKINVFLEVKHEASYRLRFEVEDTGKGIQPDKLEAIFDSFNQEDGSITRQYGGTGLGLTISRKLVEMQGGRIFASSEPGQGATFSFLIDYGLAEENEYVQFLNPEKILLDMKGKSLLLIDDDSMNHILLKPLFKKWNLDFEGFTNGGKGLARAREKTFDFVLADLQMPDMSGWEVVEGIRSFGESKEAKIVLCTANALVEQQSPEKMQLLDGLLLKPFKEIEVSSLIGSLIGGDNEILTDDQPAVQMEDKKYSLHNFRVFANNDDQLLRSFIDSFIEANQENLRLMERYLKSKDYPNLGDVAHKMKNTYGQLEARQIMHHLAELESLVDEDQAHKVVAEHVNEVVLKSDELFRALQNEVEEQQV